MTDTMQINKTRDYLIKFKSSWGFIRGRLGKPCSCGCVASALCDYPVGDGKTCDRLLCEDTPCGHLVAPDTHYCQDHYLEWKKFKDGGGVENVLKNVIPFKERKENEIR